MASEVTVKLIRNTTEDLQTFNYHPCLYLHPNKEKRVDSILSNKWQKWKLEPFDSYEIVSIKGRVHDRQYARGHPGMSESVIWALILFINLSIIFQITIYKFVNQNSIYSTKKGFGEHVRS